MERRPDSKGSLDASLIPLEQALIHRANLLSTHESGGQVELKHAIERSIRVHASAHITADVLADAMADVISSELRKLAEELRHW